MVGCEDRSGVPGDTLAQTTPNSDDANTGGCNPTAAKTPATALHLAATPGSGIHFATASTPPIDTATDKAPTPDGNTPNARASHATRSLRACATKSANAPSRSGEDRNHSATFPNARNDGSSKQSERPHAEAICVASHISGDNGETRPRTPIRTHSAHPTPKTPTYTFSPERHSGATGDSMRTTKPAGRDVTPVGHTTRPVPPCW